jgi:sugar/nucleoside kinase (ribokinase family)
MSVEIPRVDVAGVGLNATDTIIRLPRFPSLDDKVELLTAQVCPGGQVASALVACRRWGLAARYIGKVGDDEAGQLQRETFAREGVEVHLLEVPGKPSQIAYILVDQRSGERSILWKRDAALEIRPEEICKEWVTRARALHVDGHDTAAATAAARFARGAGVPVMADIDRRYAGVEDLLRNVDYLVASREFPERLTGEADLPKALRAIKREYGCRLTAATLGRRGVLAWDGANFQYCAAYKVKTLDTTSAGDIFHGAFLYALLKDWPLRRMLEFSCAAAALNCTALGARGEIAPVAEIEAFARNGARQEAVYDEAALNR